MTDTITLTGLVATDPRYTITTAGLPITSFRLASTQRRFDRTQDAWVDGETNWYTISTFRQLAANAATSINKGERVVVTGRVRLRDWQTAEKSGMNIDIEADALGHDLSWGTARWARTSQPQSSAGSPSTTDQATASAAVPDDDSTASDEEPTSQSDGEDSGVLAGVQETPF